MCRCLQKATIMHPNAIFFLLHFGAKPQNYGLILTCFSPWCDPGAISLSDVAFHMESENMVFCLSAKALWSSVKHGIHSMHVNSILIENHKFVGTNLLCSLASHIQTMTVSFGHTLVWSDIMLQ